MPRMSDETQGQHGQAPTLPEIHDEAGDSPMSLPLLGLGLFLGYVSLMVVMGVFQDAEPPAEDAPAAENAAAEEAPEDTE